LISLIGFGYSVGAQSRPKAGKILVDLDSSIVPFPGKRVFYQLTPDEGGTPLDSKAPAIITYDYRGERDEQGRLVVDVFVMRPAHKGGAFDKARVPGDSGRTAGTWDTAQTGDLAGH
jgi:hypothetical protein